MAYVAQSAFWEPRLQQRFLAKVRELPSGCWEFIGSVVGRGYGSFNAGRDVEGNKRSMPAHVVSYRIFVGEVPVDLVLDHLCRLRRCVNPWHLEPVTQKVNIHRGQLARGVGIAVTHCPAGHAYDEANTYIGPFNKRYCRACGRDATRRYLERKAAA